MVNLQPVNEHNWFKVIALELSPEQETFTSSPLNILARAYVYRDNNARAFAIYSNEIIVGVCLICELNSLLSTYELQQFMIDKNYQGMGYGSQALKKIIKMLKKEGRYSCLEACVRKADTIAIDMYTANGFINTRQVESQVPDSLLLRYCFKKSDY